jgi:hypothetical protein
MDYVQTQENFILGDNLNNIRRGISRHFRNKKREYLKNKINEVASNKNNKNIRDQYRINTFKKGCQPRSNLVKMRMVIFLQIALVNTVMSLRVP